MLRNASYQLATLGRTGRVLLHPSQFSAHAVPSIQGAAGSPEKRQEPISQQHSGLPTPASPRTQLCAALGPGPGEPQSPLSCQRGCQGLASSQGPEVSTKGPGGRSGGSGTTLHAAQAPPAALVLLRACWSHSLDSTTGVGALRAAAPPHHALSHHPVPEALLTAASHLSEKGSHWGRWGGQAPGALAAFSHRATLSASCYLGRRVRVQEKGNQKHRGCLTVGSTPMGLGKAPPSFPERSRKVGLSDPRMAE